ncbi:unnamed protein product [Phytophthora fragariaefolia]|uniref:Unnamed protein product n=1 Tax=Phytophthora fragariaefolia TaxID=1490495 RepID=A0A9W6WVQ8_9STRA|nr:unnamed protein product [Phytophthora fragariaefolia]
MIVTTLTSMIVTPRPLTTLSAEPRQSRRTAGLKTAAVAETSPTEGSTATPATKALTDVVVRMDGVRHAGVLTTPPTTVSSVPSLQRRFKLGSPPTETGLVPIGLPQLASPPVAADYVYAFVGESKWLNTQRREEAKEANTTEIEKERNGSFGGGESDERTTEEWNSGGSEGLVSSVTKKTGMATNPRIVISERFAKQLRLREVRDHGRCMEIQGFTKGTMATTKRALAKVTLRWNQVYEYELWVMDHGAGVDVVLGTDFMIPVGVRLDLFHAAARLPDEVEIPLINTQRMAGTREEGPHVPDGPTEVLTIPGHESRDYRPMRQPPANETHELWVRRTKELIPKGCGVATRPSTAGTGDEHLGSLSHVPSASTSLAVGSQRGPTEGGRVRATRLGQV